MPNGMYGGVRGEIKSPLLDCGMDRLLKSEEGVSMYEKIQGRIAEKTGIIMNIGGRR